VHHEIAEVIGDYADPSGAPKGERRHPPALRLWVAREPFERRPLSQSDALCSQTDAHAAANPTVRPSKTITILRICNPGKKRSSLEPALVSRMTIFAPRAKPHFPDTKSKQVGRSRQFSKRPVSQTFPAS